METIKKIIKILKNKYVLAGIIFIVWLTFFDSYSLIKRYNVGKKLRQLKRDKKYYREEVKNDSIALYQLQSGPENLEKFARERYMMKKDSEDIYVVVKKTPTDK